MHLIHLQKDSLPS